MRSQWDLVSSFWLKTEGDSLCPIGVSDQSNRQNCGDIVRGNGRNAAAWVKETILKCACAANESAVKEKQPHVHFGCNGIVCRVDTGSSRTSLGDTTPFKERLYQGGRKGHTLWGKERGRREVERTDSDSSTVPTCSPTWLLTLLEGGNWFLSGELGNK